MKNKCKFEDILEHKDIDIDIVKIFFKMRTDKTLRKLNDRDDSEYQVLK